ncbi:unnamed protein product [Boreogadus saida]
MGDVQIEVSTGSLGGVESETPTHIHMRSKKMGPTFSQPLTVDSNEQLHSGSVGTEEPALNGALHFVESPA